MQNEKYGIRIPDEKRDKINYFHWLKGFLVDVSQQLEYMNFRGITLEEKIQWLEKNVLPIKNISLEKLPHSDDWHYVYSKKYSSY